MTKLHARSLEQAGRMLFRAFFAGSEKWFRRRAECFAHCEATKLPHRTVTVIRRNVGMSGKAVFCLTAG
jgi:hypothetical protein